MLRFLPLLLLVGCGGNAATDPATTPNPPASNNSSAMPFVQIDGDSGLALATVVKLNGSEIGRSTPPRELIWSNFDETESLLVSGENTLIVDQTVVSIEPDHRTSPWVAKPWSVTIKLRGSAKKNDPSQVIHEAKGPTTWGETDSRTTHTSTFLH